MTATELLRQYCELVEWEITVADPAGIVTDTARYPDPWQQRAEYFAAHWQPGDAGEVTRGGSVTKAPEHPVTAFETEAAVIIVDDCTGDGCFRIPKKTGP